MKKKSEEQRGKKTDLLGLVCKFFFFFVLCFFSICFSVFFYFFHILCDLACNLNLLFSPNSTVNPEGAKVNGQKC